MTLCTELACCHVVDQITTVLYSNSYYASVFLLGAASYKAICGVASVSTSEDSQPFWLK